jgi:hypothetical protein
MNSCFLKNKKGTPLVFTSGVQIGPKRQAAPDRNGDKEH